MNKQSIYVVLSSNDQHNNVLFATADKTLAINFVNTENNKQQELQTQLDALPEEQLALLRALQKERYRYLNENGKEAVPASLPESITEPLFEMYEFGQSIYYCYEVEMK